MLLHTKKNISCETVINFQKGLRPNISLQEAKRYPNKNNKNNREAKFEATLKFLWLRSEAEKLLIKRKTIFEAEF